MVYFDKIIEETITNATHVITLADFTGLGALVSYGVFQLEKLSIAGTAISPIPTYIMVNATVGSPTVNSDNVSTPIIGYVRQMSHDGVTYVYEGNVNNDKFAALKLPAATVSVTLTFQDQDGVAIAVPTNFQNIRYRARILGK